MGSLWVRPWERRWGRFRTIVVVLGVVLAACGTVATRGTPIPTAATAPLATRPDTPVSVALFGDSLAAQAAPDFDSLLRVKGVTVTNHVFGGTAVCDWLASMPQAAASRPRAVVLEFSGNTLTPCMQGCPPETESAVTRYCNDVDGAIALFSSVGAKVFLVGTPISYAESVGHDPHWDDLNRALEALAAGHAHSTTFVDAGRAVEGSDGSFVWTLPCLSDEPCTGPIVSGVRSNVVRASDGAHLCQSPPAGGLGCAGYSSGAMRFARAMAEPVLRSVLS